MPSKTKQQSKFMNAAAHNPKFAKKAGIPQSVAEEFSKADKGRRFSEGGMGKKNVKANPFKGKESAAEEKAEGKKANPFAKKFARGGGVESRGKTKGRVV